MRLHCFVRLRRIFNGEGGEIAGSASERTERNTPGTGPGANRQGRRPRAYTWESYPVRIRGLANFAASARANVTAQPATIMTIRVEIMCFALTSAKKRSASNRVIIMVIEPGK